MTNAARLALLVLAGVLSCGPGRLDPRIPPSPPPGANSVRVGPGFVLTSPPQDLELPSNFALKPVAPKVTPDFAGPPTSNKWWSSLIWQNDTNNEKNAYSEAMYAHPLTVRARAEGLALGYPTRPSVSETEYMYFAAEDVLVGLEGLTSPDARVASYSDWAVTAAFRNGENELRATFGHGLPFVYFTTQGKLPARITPRRETDDKKQEGVDVWHEGGEWIGFSVADRYYAAFGPSGSEWKASGNGFVSDLAGKKFFSVAVLPDREAATVELFRTHAYAFVTDTKVTWSYDAPSATVRSTFDVKTDLAEEGRGRVNEPLLALYRHQWLATKSPLLDKSYASPRGEMKLMKGRSFTTEHRVNGVLPILPNVAAGDESDLAFYVKQVHWQKDLFPPGQGDKPQRDSYWDGKSMLRLANVLQIADQIGNVEARDYLLQAVKNELENWFDGREPCVFYYDKTWRTLIGAPAGFFSNTQLNDHQFHYGYFVFAAAIVARYDPAWAVRWAAYVNLLIKDVANWERDDKRFPFLRNMDVYAGHSWASGPAQFKVGNNEESSSEDVTFSAGVVLWGASTDNQAVRDLGLFLYGQQVAAIEQYWWDVDHQVFPKGFGHTAVAMVWGAGGRYTTWFDPHPIFVHGINFLPASGGSLYMGRHPAYVLQNYAEVVRRNKGQPLTWRDIMWMYLALADPQQALTLFEDNRHFTPEFGNSTAMTYHWMSNLKALGRLDTTVVADVPTYAVFEQEGRRTHVAFNPTGKPLKVKFSDGVSVDVAPRRMATAAGRR